MLVFPSSRRHKNCVFCQFLDDLPPPNPAYITSLRISWDDSNGTPSWRANSPGFSKIKRGSAVTVDSSLKMETSGKSTTSFPKVGEGQTPLAIARSSTDIVM